MSIQVVQQTASTQDDLLAFVREDASQWGHLAGLRAQVQRAGRGRSGRQWRTEGVRALTVSYVLRPSAPLETWGTIALRAGVAVVRALENHGHATSLKWPNDIVIPSSREVAGWHGIGKVGGVLGSVARDSRNEYVCIVGIGINLDGHVDLPSAETLESDIDAHRLAEEIRGELRGLVPQSARALPDLDPLMELHCSTLGKRVAVSFPRETPPREIRGLATRVDPDGALVVATEVGEKRILNGDIAHTRLQAPLG